MLRFSLASLLAVLFFVSVGSAALANATDLWRQVTVTLMVVCLLFATLAAVFSKSRARLFAGGFAVTGWLYLMLAFVSVLGLRDDMLTDRAIQWLRAAIHDDDGATGFGRALADFDNDGTLDLYVTMANGAYAQPSIPLSNMTTIGHALWTIIVGWLGGVAVLWLRRNDAREH